MSEIFSGMNLIEPKTGGMMPSVSLPSQNPVAVQEVTPAVVKNEPAADQVDISTKQKKKGPIKKFKGFISNIKKFFVTTGEYIKGGVKGIATGAVAGGVIYSAGEATNKIISIKAGMTAKKQAKAAAEKALSKIQLKEIADKAKEACKKIKFHKPLAFVAAGIALIGALWNASLNASQKRSEIEHRYEGHNN